MRIITLLCLVFAAAYANDYHFDEIATYELIEKQRKVLDVLSGVAVHNLDSKYHQEGQPFTFDKPSFYTLQDDKVVADFVQRLKRGFLPRDAVFSMNDIKARHDTFNLFEIFFFAKDFDTFIQIAEWAKNQLNPMQFAYAFIVAVYQRKDCIGIYVPPSYEIFPHYYVPSHIMRQADIASMNEVKERVFELNNTGHEFSWYRDVGPHWTKENRISLGYDVENRISYFREDPGLSHWYSTFMMRFATWLSPKLYPGIDFVNRGEIILASLKFMLSKYNMERLSVDLPPVTPLDSKKPIVGYNPGLVDSLGYRIVNRPDNMVQWDANPKGFYHVEFPDSYFQALGRKIFIDFSNKTLSVKDIVDIKGKFLFGDRDDLGLNYEPWFFVVSEAMSDMVHSSNDRDYPISAMSKHMTQVRDPVFWQLLSFMDRVVSSHTDRQAPYTKEELLTKGIQVIDITFDQLVTYIERWQYEITEGVLFKKPEDRQNKRYLVSQPRLNHKPFKVTLNIKSDRAMTANIRIMLGPQPQFPDQQSLNLIRHHFYSVANFLEELKPGENVIERRSSDFYEKYEPTREVKLRMEQTNNSTPFKVNTMLGCEFPENLMLPRGRTGGKDYSIFVMVNEGPEIDTVKNTSKRYHCLTRDLESYFPFDKPVPFNEEFFQPNMLLKPVKIYHQEEVDIST